MWKCEAHSCECSVASILKEVGGDGEMVMMRGCCSYKKKVKHFITIKKNPICFIAEVQFPSEPILKDMKRYLYVSQVKIFFWRIVVHPQCKKKIPKSHFGPSLTPAMRVLGIDWPFLVNHMAGHQDH